jgi:O-antigen/teichoic acid export membrane protein
MSAIQTDKTKLKTYYLKVTFMLSSLNIPIYLLIIILAKEILIILYGSKYVEANLILSFLAISYCTSSIGNPVGSLQIATGRTDIGLRWVLFVLIVTPLVIYFSSLISINTVAFMRALLSFVLIIPMWWMQLKPMAHIKLGEYFAQFIKPYLLLLIIAAACLLCSNFYELPFGTIVNAVIKGSIAVAVYVGLLWLIDKKRMVEIYNLLHGYRP